MNLASEHLSEGIETADDRIRKELSLSDEIAGTANQLFSKFKESKLIGDLSHLANYPKSLQSKLNELRIVIDSSADVNGHRAKYLTEAEEFQQTIHEAIIYRGGEKTLLYDISLGTIVAYDIAYSTVQRYRVEKRKDLPSKVAERLGGVQHTVANAFFKAPHKKIDSDTLTISEITYALLSILQPVDYKDPHRIYLGHGGIFIDQLHKKTAEHEEIKKGNIQPREPTKQETDVINYMQYTEDWQFPIIVANIVGKNLLGNYLEKHSVSVYA